MTTNLPEDTNVGLSVTIADILLARQVVSISDLDHAMSIKDKLGGTLEDILLSQGSCSEDDVIAAQSEFLDLPVLSDWLEIKGIKSVSSAPDSYDLDSLWWREQKAFPLGESDDEVYVAVKNIYDFFVVNALEQKTGKPVQTVLVTSHELRQLQHLLEDDVEDDIQGDADSLRDLAAGAPIIQFVNNIIQRGIDANASDIHFESYRGVFRVRLRVDGVLHEIDQPGQNLQSGIVSRLKLMAGLDISERRLPQDGRIRIRVSGRDLDIRVATSPGIAGENVVLRLLDREEGVSSLDDLGLFDDHLSSVQRLLSATSGIILVTGPTGSGKTTTLYTFLDLLANDERKIITVEDPVEFQVPGITQIQVQSEIGLNFASVLRSVLRQDPDVILLGEIRDKETAEIAIQAALTGHLVLATLHTNDAPSSIVRLMDMGIENYLLASSVIGVLAQRLVRKMCPVCKEPTQDTVETSEFLNIKSNWPDLLADESSMAFSIAKGCSECLGAGFKGRQPIFEVFEMDQDCQHVVSTAPETLDQLLKSKKMRSLREDGLIRAANGQTTISEVLRVTG